MSGLPMVEIRDGTEFRTGGLGLFEVAVDGAPLPVQVVSYSVERHTGAPARVTFTCLAGDVRVLIGEPAVAAAPEPEEDPS